jgi:exopolyphosphatase/guanosine-5'-triphosphate,3'-diphosphate pyrophosphatase
VSRVAVVDLGTNSTRLLVADVESGNVREIDRRITITRLGEGVDADRVLLPGAIERVVSCLAGYQEIVVEQGAERTLAYATSAVRDAMNGDRFLAGVQSELGFETRLLSGDEEALLTFRGATLGRDLEGPTVVIDIGGGSTEIVLGDRGGLLFSTSLDIGCVRLAERFASCDTIGTCDREALVLFVRALLMERVPYEPLPALGIGTAGTVTTLATLHLGLPEEDPEVLHGHRLPAGWISREAARLAATPVEELRQRPGIAPERAPVIAAGALALAEIVGYFELTELEVSEWDILHGVALELANAG